MVPSLLGEGGFASQLFRQFLDYAAGAFALMAFCGVVVLVLIAIHGFRQRNHPSSAKVA